LPAATGAADRPCLSGLLTSSEPTFEADHIVTDIGRDRLSIGTIKRGIRLPLNKNPRAI
jgi:hypothetical protein